VKKFFFIAAVLLSVQSAISKISDDVKLDFSDVLIVPKNSPFKSRNDVEVTATIHFKYSDYVWKGIPIIVSNIDTTGTVAMALALQNYKILTCLHKFYTADDIPDTLDKNYYMVSTGTGQKDLDRLDAIIKKHDPIFICVDVANGYSQHFIEVIKLLRKKYPHKVLVGGNVVTAERTKELIHAGLDIVKVGIGSGSVCVTRLQTGIGYPQLSAVLECAKAAHEVGGLVISDGGIVYPGDFSKAFGAGADFIMCGGMFAGHDESGGEVVEIEGKHYKIFYGMASSTAMHKYHGGVADYRSSEGKTVKVPYKGPVKNTIQNILGGIRSTMTYIGAGNIADIERCTTFIRVNAIVNKIYNGHEV
jgi:GMP reductase